MEIASRPVRLFCFSPQCIAYDAAWQWQQSMAAAIRERGAPEAIALLEHAPVYTFGRRPRHEHLLIDPESLRASGAEVIESDRGGDVTYHGPGQLVAYPILDLKARALGPGAYVRALEETAIETLSAFDIAASRWPGRPGVWIDGAKVAAIGVRVQGGVSSHGIALNVETDLARYDAIVPCGIRDASVTSIERVLGFSPGVAAVQDAFVRAFEAVFDSKLEPPPMTPDKEPALAHGR